MEKRGCAKHYSYGRVESSTCYDVGVEIYRLPDWRSAHIESTQLHSAAVEIKTPSSPKSILSMMQVISTTLPDEECRINGAKHMSAIGHKRAEMDHPAHKLLLLMSPKLRRILNRYQDNVSLLLPTAALLAEKIFRIK
ncbi:MAG: hypothetical protein CL912_09415 [Deltaproteobacteria bacterium]|nr:hypothetical protein [Deltaproteobacteria bacterium]